MGAIGKIPEQNYNKYYKPPIGGNDDPSYKLSGNFGWNVGGINPTKPSHGVEGGKPIGPQRVEGENGEQIAYTDNRGYVGLTASVASPFAGGQAGRKEKPDFIPRELGVA